MHKDIRSYFQRKQVQTETQADDDEIPESPDVQIKNKKVTKKRRVIAEDSDEEIFPVKKKNTDKSSNSKSSHKSKSSSKPTLKEVKPSDLFCNGPIKRSAPLVKKEVKTETGIHSDEEFENSLLEIDNVEFAPQTNECNTSTKKPKNNTNNEQVKYENSSNEKSVKFDKAGSSKEISNKSSKSDDVDSRKEKYKKTLTLTKESHKNDDHSTSKTINKFVDSSTDKISKLDKSKRKFSEFLDSDSNHDQGNGKKKKVGDSNHEESRNDSGRSNNYDQKANVKRSEKKDKQNLSSLGDTDVDDKQAKKKDKLNKSLNDSALTDEERHERRIASAALYKSYLNRSGPKHLGSKEIPEGTPGCLKDCAFVLTGVLDSFEKDEVAMVINKYGGSVKSGVSKKVTHVIAGEDAGPAKIAKAQELGVPIINEDEFLQMITKRSKTVTDKHDKKIESKKDKSPQSSVTKHKDKVKVNDKSETKDKSKNKSSPTDKYPVKSTEKTKIESKSKVGNDVKCKLDINESKSRDKSKSPNKTKGEINIEVKDDKKSDVPEPKQTLINGNASMWVEKYKPQNIKQIIGQHGDASNVKKLVNWLTKWYVNRKAKLPKPSPWAKNDDGGYFKAALLSGPPGVGKTTTVALVCAELGFDMVEFNASDTRNKTLIKEQIGELLTTNSLAGFAKGETGKLAVSKKHVLVMDEVDGMAGNEDRGGLQELISLIKSASVPIICMCNDRNSQKMRSLVNYCYDLRFSRPRVDQIKSAMMSICFKEGIKIPPDVLSQLIVSANQDVRQTLNLLSMWAIDPSRTDTDRLRKDAQTTKKDIKLGPWDAIRKVFSAEEHKSMSISDKSDLFFYDYSLAPLFVQENYLQVAPHCDKREMLDRISKAADSISMGDLVDARIRRYQAWNLLPLQAMHASVIPGHEMSGHMTGQIQFPGWLGKNSRTTKMKRLCQEIHAHTRLSTSGSKSSIFLDYSSHIRDAIVNPLIKDRMDGISQSLQVLESYHLLREDLDSLVELSVWPGQRNPTVLIDSKVKAAMTRTYNKNASALPYAPGSVKRVRARQNDGDELEGEGDDDVDEESPDSDPENDALIKKKKTKEVDKPGPSKEKAGTKPSSGRKKKDK